MLDQISIWKTVKKDIFLFRMFYNNCQGIYSIIYLLIEIRYYNQYGYYCAHLTV